MIGNNSANLQEAANPQIKRCEVDDQTIMSRTPTIPVQYEEVIQAAGRSFHFSTLL